VGATLFLALLSWPAPRPDVGPPGTSTAFRWDADSLFAALETEFAALGGQDESAAAGALDALLAEGDALLARIAQSGGTTLGGPPSAPPSAPLDALTGLATLQMRTAVLGAAHPALLARVSDFLVRSRVAVMTVASAWTLDRPTHEALYRVVFGGRIALDEALAQAGVDALPELLVIEDVPSATPSAVIEGVRIHSGDMLLSRGGAPTSALIARGNDFPNTFSHVALAHVDATTGRATAIESLIEAGSVTTSVEEYLASKKHRIVVLRLRPDHPALAADPLLPHRAAEAVLAQVRAEHLPYDFAMDWHDESAAFCSEIVYHTFRDHGVELWSLKSSMTAAGLVRWLADMGVREFTSLVPSDIEYDPQVRAVVEWRNAPELMEYRLDNAITDALLEEAERGARLGYAWYALPAARVLKGYSSARALLGAEPAIPVGMSAATALRVDALVSRVHPAVREELVARARAFREERGHEAPYWSLVELARASLAATRAGLAPALTAD